MILVDVYDSSIDLDVALSKYGPVIGVSEYARKKLGISTGDYILVKNDDLTIKLRVERTDRRLENLLSNVSRAHCMLSGKYREELNLTLQCYRVSEESFEKYNQIFGKVELDNLESYEFEFNL